MRLGKSLTLLLSLAYASTKASSSNTDNADSADVNNIINRRLEASIRAHDWPTTPSSPLCEAFAYIDSAPGHASSSSQEMYQSWKRSYFESLIDGTAVQADADSGSYINGVRKAVHAATTFFKEETENIDLKLLKYALATRAHAPLCEMHRSLAQAAIGVFPERELAENALALGAFSILQDINSVTVSYATGVNGDGHPDFIKGVKVPDVVGNPLPDEEPIYHMSESTGSVAVLYGSFDSPTFAALYKALTKQSIPFVVRHISATQFSKEESSEAIGIGGTALQGYGVRLDIRNVEYKSFDDKADTSEQTKSPASATEVDAKYENLNSEEIKDLFTNGIDPTALEHPSSEVNQFLEDYLPQLKIISDDATSLKDHIHIPPKSELTNLPIQATHVISQSKDPLWTLQQISQNLPSFASALGNVTVPSNIEKRIASVQTANGMGDAIMSFHVNGRKIEVERPSFNLFELINVIREENELLKSVDELDLSDEAKAVVVNFLSMGKDDFDELSNDDDGDDADAMSNMSMMNVAEPKLRINVGSGYRGAVIFLNDIEKDPEYANFPTNIQQALYGMQFRGTLTIRRNVLTVLLVLDPFDTQAGYLESLRLLLQMMQSGIPVRVGVVFATDKDIDLCKDYINSGKDLDGDCLSTADASSGARDDKGILESKATTEDIMKVCQQVMAMYGKSIGMPYLYLTLNEIKSGMTVRDLAYVHSEVLHKMGAPVENPVTFIEEAVRQDHNTDPKVENYAAAVRFAATKNIRPGMAFVNGIPFAPQECENVLMEEMQRIAGMMMAGQITDSSPRSIYAFLLKGRNVRKSMHPLFSEESPKYKIGSGNNDDGCIFKLNESNDPKRPTIMIEAVADLVSQDGLNYILSLLDALSITKTKIKTLDTNKQTTVAFRISPSDMESSKSPVAAIFRRANQFDFDTLVEFVKTALQLTETSKAVQINAYSHDNNAHKILLEDSCVGGSRECAFEPIPAKYQSSTILYVNGRIFNPKTTVDADDIEVLIALERGAAKTIVEGLVPYLNGSQKIESVAKTAAFLAQKFSSEEFTANERSDVFAPYRELAKDGVLHFIWNNERDDDKNGPGVKISVVLDPLSDATQRAAPLLRIIRDTFKLPLELVLFPRLRINEDSSLPLTSYYRFVAGAIDFESEEQHFSKASFEGLPANQVLTIRMDVPEPWDIQQSSVIQDTDNLRCDTQSCGDDAYATSLRKNRGEKLDSELLFSHLTEVEYSLNSLLLSGQCYDASNNSPPNGLQLTLSDTILSGHKDNDEANYEILPDGSVSDSVSDDDFSSSAPSTGTLVMKTVGYWQLRSRPGIWQLKIADNTRGAEMYEIVKGNIDNGRIQLEDSNMGASNSKMLIMKDFVNTMELILVERTEGYETEELLAAADGIGEGDDDTVHVFSLATGHLYERFLKIMMLSVTKRTSTRVKFWFLENFLSPSFKESAFAMAEEIGCEIEFVTYKWPEWLRAQSEKQRIIWGYKILFLDVLFPLDLKKIIYVDADQVVRGDLKELWDIDLEGAPYGYTPMCESREETKGYQFWRDGFWPAHLNGKPYHISALYVVDLQRFRRELVGDQLRAVYQQLTADPNNLSNLDQDLPNYTQNQIKIFSLPQDWLWCESWCSEETKGTAKTIDLCNNPEHKEPKVLMAKRIISGDLFEESWVDLDAEVDAYERKYISSQ